MKILLILLSLLLFSCAPVLDQAISPASLNQKTLLMKHNGNTFQGILPVTDLSELDIFVFGEGSLDVTGTGECTYFKSFGTKEIDWTKIKLNEIPDADICILNLTSTINILDAPAIGNIVLRQFNNPNIEKLSVTIKNKTNLGIHGIQYKSFEDHNIILRVSGSEGMLVLTGCEKEVVKPYTGPTINIPLSELDDLIGDAESCAVTVTANNDDYLKESASIYLSRIRELGSDLPSPIFEIKNSKACFKFTDKYVFGMAVNGKASKLNKRELCVKKSSSYEVIGATSKHRVFYSIFDNQEWK